MGVPAGCYAGSSFQFRVPAAVAPAPQMMRPQPQRMKVVCPPGVTPGAMLRVALADGRVVTVQVPPGVTAGMQFEIEV